MGTSGLFRLHTKVCHIHENFIAQHKHMRPKLATTKPLQTTWKHIIHQRFDAHADLVTEALLALTNATLNPVHVPEQDVIQVHMLAFEAHHRTILGKTHARPIQLWGVEVQLSDQTSCLALLHVHAKRARLVRTHDILKGHAHTPSTHVFINQDSLVRCTHEDASTQRLVEVTAMEPCFVDPQPRGLTMAYWRTLAGDLYEMTHQPWPGWKVQSHRQRHAWPAPLKLYEDALCSAHPTQTNLFEGAALLFTPHTPTHT